MLITGGQFGPKQGGQFALKQRGHFAPKWRGQFGRNIHFYISAAKFTLHSLFYLLACE